jgi:predicted nucleic acid-binding Zn ribbon protein
MDDVIDDPAPGQGALTEGLVSETPPTDKPHRRCMACATMVPEDEVLERDRGGKPFVAHRRSVRNGNVIESKICGPLVRKLVYHVYGKHQEIGQPERTFRTLLTANMPPEEDWEILTLWEAYLERERTAKGADAEPLPDAPKVTVVVERWHMVAAKA